MALAAYRRKHLDDTLGRGQVSVTLELRGFDEAIQLLDGVDIPGQLADIVDFVVGHSVRVAASLTPVDTGAMRMAWMGQAHGSMGRVFIDPAAVNYRSGARVTSYAGIVDERIGISGAVADRATRMAVSMMGDIEWTPR